MKRLIWLWTTVCFLILAASFIQGNEVNSEDELEERIFDFTKCHGAGCPYTASWLVHINLLNKAHWWLDSTKMEAASFVIFDKAHFKFQVSDPDAYYVHHMSMYEHLQHKKFGFDVAKEKTLTMSQAAFHGECDRINISESREFLAIIPFYGGLPPNVTSDLSVKSIGQGNSLVDAGTKALQCMATLCSTLRYFGHAVIGVAREEDRELIISMLDKVDSKIRKSVHVVQFMMNKPAHLPFHLIGWTQNYVQQYNCQGSSHYPAYSIPTHRHSRVLINAEAGPPARNPLGKRSHGSAMHRHSPSQTLYSKNGMLRRYVYASDDIFNRSASEVYQICDIDFARHHHGHPIQVAYHRKSVYHRNHNDSDVSLYKDPVFDISMASPSGEPPINAFHPIRYVYYSESDQIVRFDGDVTFQALRLASNDSTFFTGRRREKSYQSNPVDYMGSLDNWRNCGMPGYSMHWPNETLVRFHG